MLIITFMVPTISVVPRLSSPPAFDCLQYAKTEREGLVNPTTSSAARGVTLYMHTRVTEKTEKTDLALCTSYEYEASVDGEQHQVYKTYPS